MQNIVLSRGDLARKWYLIKNLFYFFTPLFSHSSYFGVAGLQVVGMAELNGLCVAYAPTARVAEADLW
jgi:hypothetical protein